MDESEDASVLDDEVRYFEEHQVELRRRHPRKYVLIKGQELLGAYDSFEAAYESGLKTLGNKPMLIRHVDHEDVVHSVPAMMYHGGANGAS